MDAVRPDFVRQFTFVDSLEPQLLEETGLISQGEYLGNAIFRRLGQTALYEFGTDTPALKVFQHRQ